MSRETFQALEDAVRAHITDTLPGAYLTDWSLMAASAVAEAPGATRYYAEYSDAPMHTHIGLAAMLMADIQGQNRRDVTP